jgi:hypothetical protein
MNLARYGRLVIAASFVALGCALAQGSGFTTTLRLSAAPGVEVPSIEQLARRIDDTPNELPGIRTLVSRDGKQVEVQRLRPGPARSALVRSFDAATGKAYVAVQRHPHYRMPALQIWRFDGKAWGDSVDPGIFAGRSRDPR